MPDENGNLTPAEMAAQNAHAAAAGPSLAETMGQSHASGPINGMVTDRTSGRVLGQRSAFGAVQDDWARAPGGGSAPVYGVKPGNAQQPLPTLQAGNMGPGDQPNAVPPAPAQNARPDNTLATPRQGNYSSNDKGIGQVGALPTAGPIEEAASTLDPNTTYSRTAPGAASATGITSSAGAPPANMTTDQSNEYYQKLHASMDAKDAQGLEQQRAEGNARNISAGLSRDIDHAKSEARVAGWYAQNQPDQVTHTNAAGRSYQTVPKAAAAGILTAQQEANQNLNTLQGEKLAADKASVQPRNYIDEYAKATPSLLDAREQQGRIGLQGLAGQEGQQKLQLGGQALQAGGMQLHLQQHLTDLQARAAAPGPDGEAARNALAFYQKANSGKGGPLTEEDALKVYGDMVSRATAMGGPDAYKSLPHFNEWFNTLRGGPQGPPADWMTRAKAANPGASEADLAAFYAKKQQAQPAAQ